MPKKKSKSNTSLTSLSSTAPTEKEGFGINHEFALIAAESHSKDEHISPSGARTGAGATVVSTETLGEEKRDPQGEKINLRVQVDTEPTSQKAPSPLGKTRPGFFSPKAVAPTPSTPPRTLALEHSDEQVKISEGGTLSLTTATKVDPAPFLKDDPSKDDKPKKKKWSLFSCLPCCEEEKPEDPSDRPKAQRMA